MHNLIPKARYAVSQIANGRSYNAALSQFYTSQHVTTRTQGMGDALKAFMEARSKKSDEK